MNPNIAINTGVKYKEKRQFSIASSIKKVQGFIKNQ